MAKRRKRKRAAEQYREKKIYAAAPGATPIWIRENDGTVEIDPSIAYDEPPENVVKAAVAEWGSDNSFSNGILFWQDMPNVLARMKSDRLYGRGVGGIWRAALEEIPVMKGGEPIGWYDLDAGLVQYASLYDLAFEKQPLIVDGRKLFLMTEEMWENEEYPPEVGKRTTSKER